MNGHTNLGFVDTGGEDRPTEPSAIYWIESDKKDENNERQAPRAEFDMDPSPHNSDAEHIKQTGSREKRKKLNKNYWKDLGVGCLAEVVGTAIFLYVAVLSGQSDDIFSIAFCSGGVICLLIITFANISGAHFNPAASLGFFIIGEISFLRLICYSLSQIAGSITGAFLARGVLSSSIIVRDGLPNITEYEYINGGAHFLNGGITPGLAIAAEALYCFSMMIVVYISAVDSKTKSPLAPVAIGFIIVICVISGFHNTSGSFNPVRSLGAAVAISYYRPEVWTHHYVYWVGPPAGSVVAALLYRIVFADWQHSIKRSVLKLL